MNVLDQIHIWLRDYFGFRLADAGGPSGILGVHRRIEESKRRVSEKGGDRWLRKPNIIKKMRGEANR